MRETWGPPIKLRNGKRVPLSLGILTGGLDSSRALQLTPQYRSRKRRGNTPPDDDDLPAKKKLRKVHKKFTSIGGVGMLRDGGSANTGKKKLVLLPPKPPTPPSGKTCVMCNSNPEVPGLLLACKICYRNAYCGEVCRRVAYENNGNCSTICEEEQSLSDAEGSTEPGQDPEGSTNAGEKKLRPFRPKPSEPQNGQTCVQCDEGPSEALGGELITCSICLRDAYCSIDCSYVRILSENRYCSTLCAEENQSSGSPSPPELDDPPVSTPTDEEKCVRCGGEPKTRLGLLSCIVCERKAYCSKAYCSKACQYSWINKTCTTLCAKEIAARAGPRHDGLPPKTPPDGKKCARCDKTPNQRGLVPCTVCDRKAYCSIKCQASWSDRNCSTLCADESPLSSPSDCPELDEDTSSTSSSLGELVQEGSREENLREERSPESDAGDSADMSDWDTWDIVDFRISKNDRELIYILEHRSTEERKSFPAALMKGLEWRNRMDIFWEDNEPMKEKRKSFEEPYGNVKHIAGHPFGRQILSCRFDFDGDRAIQFNTREHDEVEDDPHTDGDHSKFAPAIEYDQTWDRLIKEFWRRGVIKQEWIEGGKRVWKMMTEQSLECDEPPAVNEELRKEIESISRYTRNWAQDDDSLDQANADTPMRGIERAQ